MGAVLDYLRTHRWQRRSLTLLAALVAGAIAAMVLYPRVSEYLLVRDMGSQARDVRDRAIDRAVDLAPRSQRFRRRLEGALDSPSDVRFSAAATVLRRIGAFSRPGRDPLHVDRMRAIDIAATRSRQFPERAAETRGLLVKGAILCGRDNTHIRRALALAAEDEAAQVRQLAALLAARLGDDETLTALLGDEDNGVVAAAALDAGLAGREALAGPIGEVFRRGGGGIEVVSAAAYALARLAPREHSTAICERLASAGEPALQNRLLHVLTLLDDDNARAAVAVALGGPEPDAIPPAMAILAAGKLKVRAFAPRAKALLARFVAGETGFTEGHVVALLSSAEALNVPIRAEAYAICEKLWNPRDHQQVLAAAAEVLGRQAAADQRGGEAPTKRQCVDLLRQRAMYAVSAATQPADAPLTVLATPVPSAAAAAAMWLLRPSETKYARPADDSATQPASAPAMGPAEDFLSSAYAVTEAVAAGPAAGQLVAWRLGPSGRPEAFALGLEMLPPPPQPDVPLDRQPPRVWRKGVRSAGATLLALAARGNAQSAAAMERITSRLDGGVYGPETDFFVAGTYRCARLILGRNAEADRVNQLLATGSFPGRTAVTALLAAGRREALDALLWAPGRGPGGIASALIDDGLAEVLAGAAPSLPKVDLAADADLLGWQIRALRDAYAIGRADIRLGLPGQ